MAKVIKYGDVSKVEAGFKQAPVGLYHAKVSSIEQKTSKNDEEMVEVIFQITKDADGKKVKENYGQIWYYAPLNPDGVAGGWARRMKELVTAFGLKAKGGNIAAIEGKEALIRLREDKDLNGDYRPQIGKILKAEVEDEDDEDEPDVAAEADDDAEAEYTMDDLDDMDRTQLKQLIKEEELEIKVTKSKTEDDLREEIAAALEIEDEEDEEEPDEEDEEEPEDEDEDEGDNYDEMSVTDLRQELKDRSLESKGAKKVLIARLRTDDSEEPV